MFVYMFCSIWEHHIYCTVMVYGFQIIVDETAIINYLIDDANGGNS